jgi:malonyl-CoA O-methyltransferase
VARLAREARVTRHADVRALLASLRDIGAGNAAPGRGEGLGARRTTLSMMRLYAERHGDAGGIPATWDVVYALARRPGEGPRAGVSLPWRRAGLRDP